MDRSSVNTAPSKRSSSRSAFWIQRRDRLAGAGSTAGNRTCATMTPGNAIGDEPAVRQQVVAELGPVAPIYRQRLVRIRDHGAVTGKMFGGGGHAGVLHAGHVGERELRHGFGLGMERAIADDLADAVVEIDAGRERQVDAVRAQLGGHEPAHGAREREAVPWRRRRIRDRCAAATAAPRSRDGIAGRARLPGRRPRSARANARRGCRPPGARAARSRRSCA